MTVGGTGGKEKREQHSPWLLIHKARRWGACPLLLLLLLLLHELHVLLLRGHGRIHEIEWRRRLSGRRRTHVGIAGANGIVAKQRTEQLLMLLLLELLLLLVLILRRRRRETKHHREGGGRETRVWHGHSLLLLLLVLHVLHHHHHGVLLVHLIRSVRRVIAAIEIGRSAGVE